MDLTGEPGVAGPPGYTGATGAPGIPGSPGRSASFARLSQSFVPQQPARIVHLENDVRLVRGPPGERGHMGATGNVFW